MSKTVQTYELEIVTPIKVKFESLKSITINGFKLKVVATKEETVLKPVAEPVAGMGEIEKYEGEPVKG